MNSVTSVSRFGGKWLWPLMLLSVFVGPAAAQVPVDENGNPIAAIEQDGADSAVASGSPALTGGELEELVGPIALYPDDLLAIVLPASTYPLEIVQAARFLEEVEQDSSLKPDENWDDSVVALLNYPDVVRMMNDDIDWTWRLGEAVIAQQSDVIAAIETFRDRAYAAGNLKSDERQTVTVDDGVIEIEPVDEEIIYVPYYEPAEVVVYQPRRVYYYYPDPYPVYYYPYPAGYHFHSGFFWGVTTAFHIGWSNHYLHVYHPSYWGHPYYGRYYYDYYYYRRPSITIYNNWYVNNSYRTSHYRYRDGDYWRPRHRAGSRPDEPRVRNYYYPPNSGSRSASSGYSGSRRDDLRVRDNGRMDLNLRERSGTRTVNTRNSGFSGSADRDRSRPRNDAAGGRRTRVAGNEAGPVAGRTPSGNRGNDRPDVGLRDRTGERQRVAVGDSRSGAADSRGNERPAIEFRDRSAERQVSAASGTRRQAADTRGNREVGVSSTGRTSRPDSNRGTTRRSAPANSSRPDVDRSGGDRRFQSSGSDRQFSSAPARRQTAPTTRQSAPTVRQSAPSARAPTTTMRPSAPTVRRQAPAPRQSAPAARSPAPAVRPSQSGSRDTSSSRGSRPTGSATRGGERRSSSSRRGNQN